MVHLDVYHANIEEGDLGRPVRLAGDRLGYVHIGESHRGYLGSGTIDFPAFFRALVSAGYSGPIAFESFSSAVVSAEFAAALGVWRNLWDDSAHLAGHARSLHRRPADGGPAAGHQLRRGTPMPASDRTEPLPRGAVRFADLAGQVAVVTGGARGLGYAIAETLADCGVSVGLADLLPAVVDSADRLAETGSVPTVGVPVDVTDPDGVTALIDQVAATLGGPTILVNAAGIGPRQAALDITLDQWRQVLDVNLTGTFLSCQAFARHCRHAGSGGAIVNIASMSAQIVNVPQTQSAYNVSKAGVEALTRSLAVEWLPLGIRVNAVSPGYVLTDMTRGVVETQPDLAAVWRQRTPAGHLGDPSDIGPLVAYLASSASRFLVGQCVVIDGGYTIV